MFQLSKVVISTSTVTHIQHGHFFWSGHQVILCSCTRPNQFGNKVSSGLCIIVITPSRLQLLGPLISLICSLNPEEGCRCWSHFVKVSGAGAGIVSAHCSSILHQSRHPAIRMELEPCPKAYHLYKCQQCIFLANSVPKIRTLLFYFK